MRLNNNVSIATPEIDDINMSTHCYLVTVHAGENVLSSPLPHRAPHNRAAPQLHELQVVKGNMLS